MSKNVAQYIACFISMIIAVFLIIWPLGIENVYLAFIIVVICCIPGFVLIEKYYNKKDCELSEAMTVTTKENQLNLYKRAPIVGTAISIDPIYETYFKYNPLEVTYTSATVGGITTGGFHTSGNDYSLKMGDKTGKYRLGTKVAKEGSEGSEYMRIDRIKLTEALVADAKKDSFIKGFLNGNLLVLKHEVSKSTMTKMEDDIVRDAVSKQDWQSASLFTSKRAADAALTMEECKKVYNWICGV